jgi:hypothetical protein
MGTRADFYVGNLIRVDDKNLTLSKSEWLGSIAWDGMPYGEHVPATLLRKKRESTFRLAVEEHFKSVDHSTRPEQGWPWPWANSQTTDWAYIFDPWDSSVHFVKFSEYLGAQSQSRKYFHKLERTADTKVIGRKLQNLESSHSRTWKASKKLILGAGLD